MHTLLNSVHLMSAVDLLASLPDESIDLILTDPPYNISYCSGRNNWSSEIANDAHLPTDWLSEAHRVLKQGSAIYIYSHWRSWGDLKTAVERAGFNPKNMIVLRKSNHGMGDLKGGYAPKHELVMYAVKGRHILHPPAKRLPDVLDVPVIYSRKRRNHPCEKPVSWYIPFILSSSKVGDIVLDPFSGSASIPLACLQTDRKFIAGDLDAECVRIANERIGVYTKSDNVLLSKAV